MYWFIILFKSNFKILEGLLRAYAVHNTTISYCQGMNYIMGYIFSNLHNEEDAFYLFGSIMEKYLASLYLNGFD